MATKGTTQYNVWKAKFNAARAKKNSVPSLFPDEVVSAPKNIKTFSLDYLVDNSPKKIYEEIWYTAAHRATNGGTKNSSYGATVAIYNNLVKKISSYDPFIADIPLNDRINHMNFCSERASRELELELSL